MTQWWPNDLPDDCVKYLNTHFMITLDEARALNSLLRLHAGLFKENAEQYTQLLRLINGLGTFVDLEESKTK